MSQYKLRKITCVGCKKVVEKRQAPGRIYCSLSCYRKGPRPTRRTKQNSPCTQCGKEVYGQQFCSRDCANEYQRRNKVVLECKICGKTYKWSPSRVKTGNPTYCSMTCRNKDKDRLLENSVKGNLAQIDKKGLNRLEKAGNEILKECGLKFKEQVLKYKKFLVDVELKDHRVIIQWDGEYWHSKPKRKRLDESQDAYLKKCGYEVVRITDKQIKDKDYVVTNIRSAIRKATRRAKSTF